MFEPDMYNKKEEEELLVQARPHVHADASEWQVSLLQHPPQVTTQSSSMWSLNMDMVQLEAIIRLLFPPTINKDTLSVSDLTYYLAIIYLLLPREQY